MTKNYIYIGLFLTSVLVSCRKENSVLPNSEATDTITEIQYTSDPDYVLSNKNAQELIVHLEDEQNDLKRKLKKANKKEAEDLYVDYYKRFTTIVDSLNLAEINTLNTYHQMGTAKNDTILRKQNTYDKLGLYFRKVDSTTYDFKIKPGFFYNLFHNKISKEFEEYLRLGYVEHKLFYDQQTKNEKITLESQRNLIINWEKFITQHKNFKFIDSAKRSYSDNMMLYLFGTPAKPTFQISSKKLYVENEQEYISFVKQNPNLISAEITKSFLKHFYVNDKNFTSEKFYVDLKEFTKKEISEHIK